MPNSQGQDVPNNMDDHRKKVITNEIEYWKQNRLLPEHYCDFLLNLYSEGGSESPIKKKRLLSAPVFINIILASLLSLTVFLFYFTELSLFLQISIIIFLGISSFLAAVYLIKNSIFDLIPILSTALLLLIMSVQTVEIIFPGNPVILYIVTALNCLLWIGAGKKWTLVSFKLSGIAGLIILVITIFI